MEFSRTQKSNWLYINTMGSRGKGFSPCFRESSPRPPCVVCRTLPPRLVRNMYFPCVTKVARKGKKSLPLLTSFACSHYCRKGQRVTPFSQGFKVYANADRLCGCHYCRKGQRVTPNYKGLGSRLYCFGFPMMPPPPKGQRVTALCAYPLP